MKRLLAAVLLVCGLAAQAPCRDASGLKALDEALGRSAAALAPSLKGKVCVLDFTELADGAYTSEFGQKVAELVSNRLVNRSRRGYAVMERRELIKAHDVPDGRGDFGWRWTRAAAPVRLTVVEGRPTFEDGKPTGAPAPPAPPKKQDDMSGLY